MSMMVDKPNSNPESPFDHVHQLLGYRIRVFAVVLHAMLHFQHFEGSIIVDRVVEYFVILVQPIES